MEAYIGEIRIFAGNYAPVGWLLCQGQLLSISEHSDLYSLIGTIYGGDGMTTFALPSQSGRLVVGQGQLPGGSDYLIGEQLGVENVPLNGNQLPTHAHPLAATVGVPMDDSAQSDPTNHYFGASGASTYVADLGTGPATLSTEAVTGTASAAGAGQQHANIQPVLATNCIICTAGIYPSRG